MRIYAGADEWRECRRVAVAANATYELPTYACTDTAAVAGAAVDTIYTYDRGGNQTNATDALSNTDPALRHTIAATYDALARPTAVTNTHGPGSDSATGYSYSLSNPTRDDPSGHYGFTLDALGRQKSLTDPLHESGDNYAWEYGATGVVTGLTDPTANKTTYSHDYLGRYLVGQTTGGASACTDCAIYTYAYNAAGNRILGPAT